MSRLYKVVADVLGVDVESITDDSSPNTLKEWDSFNGLLLADRIENKFNVKFTLQEIASVKNVADIKKHLKKYGVDVDDYQ